jgi:DNA modification methylase
MPQSIATNRVHPSQKPVELMAWCMDKAKVVVGATVLDPYMGSGTTGIACIRTGRRFIGIEKDPTHYATALERIKNEIAQKDLFLRHNK